MTGTTAAVLASLEAGGRPPDAVVLRALQAAGCPARLVSVLEGCRWVRGARRVMALMLRHPSCSMSFALDAIGRVGWADMLAVAQDPRAAPAVRRLAERRLLERVGEMSQGERTSLARRAPRSLFPVLIQDESTQTTAALLDNPRFGEMDALRLVSVNPRIDCVRVVLRHGKWGRRPAVVDAVVRRKDLPLPVAAGIAVTLSERQRTQLEQSPELPAELRQVLGRLREHRAERSAGRRVTS